jgi:hypothetical protein
MVLAGPLQAFLAYFGFTIVPPCRRRYASLNDAI